MREILTWFGWFGAIGLGLSFVMGVIRTVVQRELDRERRRSGPPPSSG